MYLLFFTRLVVDVFSCLVLYDKKILTTTLTGVVNTRSSPWLARWELCWEILSWHQFFLLSPLLLTCLTHEGPFTQQMSREIIVQVTSQACRCWGIFGKESTLCSLLSNLRSHSRKNHLPFTPHFARRNFVTIFLTHFMANSHRHVTIREVCERTYSSQVIVVQHPQSVLFLCLPPVVLSPLTLTP